MKKSELRKLIRQEVYRTSNFSKIGTLPTVEESAKKLVISEGVSDSFRVRQLIDTIHNEINWLKSNKRINKKLTKKLFTNFRPLFNDLDELATYLFKKENSL